MYKKNNTKKEQALVSVIMNCFNGEKFLLEAISSVINQEYKNWELIFWDNLSTDKSKTILKNFKDSRIKYFCSKKFLNLGEARNNAIKSSKGDFIAFLDCDDIWLSGKLSSQVQLFNDHSIGIVICDTIFFSEKGYSNQYYKKNKPPQGFVFKNLLTNYYISLETVVIRRETLNQLDHWFDVNYNVIEELDLFLRISLNWKLAYVDKVLAKWRIHSESWTWTKKELFPKEKLHMLHKYIESFKDFEINFLNEINIFKQQIDFELALIEWQNNRSKKARTLIKKHRKSFKWFCLYYLTYLPFSSFEIIQKVRGRY